jgi:hypothetical protein
MKKHILLLVAMLMFGIGKAQITQGILEIDKVEHPAAVGIFTGNPQLIISVLQEDLKNRGLGKGDEKKDVYRYEDIEFKELSKEKISIYFKAEIAEKKDPVRSTLYFLVKKSDNNYVSSTVAPEVYAAVVNYINDLSLIIELRRIEAELDSKREIVKAQEAAVKEAQKKLEEAASVIKELEAQKKLIEGQIKEKGKKK